MKKEIRTEADVKDALLELALYTHSGEPGEKHVVKDALAGLVVHLFRARPAVLQDLMVAFARNPELLKGDIQQEAVEATRNSIISFDLLGAFKDLAKESPENAKAVGDIFARICREEEAPAQRYWALVSLATLTAYYPEKRAKAIGLLKEGLKDKDDYYRTCAISVMPDLVRNGAMSVETALKWLAPVAGDPRNAVRYSAIKMARHLTCKYAPASAEQAMELSNLFQAQASGISKWHYRTRRDCFELAQVLGKKAEKAPRPNA